MSGPSRVKIISMHLDTRTNERPFQESLRLDEPCISYVIEAIEHGKSPAKALVDLANIGAAHLYDEQHATQKEMLLGH